MRVKVFKKGIIAACLLFYPIFSIADTIIDKNEFKIEYFGFNSGRLVFAYEVEDGNRDIYLLDYKDLNVKPLFVSKGNDEAPVWSPDGRKILFHSDVSGTREIYQMNYDGSDMLQLTTTKSDNAYPSWSPDGTKIAFQSTRSDGAIEIFTMNSDGSNIQQITKDNKKNVTPKWSPKDDEIVFSTNQAWPGWDIAMLNVASKTEKILTQGATSYSKPTWRLDGGGLIFTHVVGDSSTLWSITKGETQAASIGEDLINATDPIWDDEGRMILFVGTSEERSKKFDLYAFNFNLPKSGTEDNKGVIKLLSGKKSIRMPNWTSLPSLSSIIKDLKKDNEAVK